MIQVSPLLQKKKEKRKKEGLLGSENNFYFQHHFCLKLVSNLHKIFLCIEWHQKPTVCTYFYHSLLKVEKTLAIFATATFLLFLESPGPTLYIAW